MFRTLSMAVIAAFVVIATSCAQENWPSPATSSETTFTNPFSFALTMPENKPHKLEVNDLSEIRETAYTQKDEVPVSPTTFPLDFQSDKPLSADPLAPAF